MRHSGKLWKTKRYLLCSCEIQNTGSSLSVTVHKHYNSVIIRHPYAGTSPLSHKKHKQHHRPIKHLAPENLKRSLSTDSPSLRSSSLSYKQGYHDKKKAVVQKGTSPVGCGEKAAVFGPSPSNEAALKGHSLSGHGNKSTAGIR